jgi:aminopeptidase-like protein
MMNVLAYADGKHDLIELADIIGQPVEKTLPIVSALLDQGILEVSQPEIPSPTMQYSH